MRVLLVMGCALLMSACAHQDEDYLTYLDRTGGWGASERMLSPAVARANYTAATRQSAVAAIKDYQDNPTAENYVQAADAMARYSTSGY